MTSSQDYYQILGVTPSAELAVIKAVYKALALKYHPDRNKGNLAAAAKKMAEINEAYSILSDEQKRAAYDRSRRGSSEQDQFDDEEEGFDSEFSSMDSQIEADWTLAKKYYPDLDAILKKFSKISSSLVLPYKLYLLETKSFSNRNEIADGMIDAYIKTYFGSDEQIVEFAKYLLKNDLRAAARELNKAVKLFGKSINAAIVINTIKLEYSTERPNENEKTNNNDNKSENIYGGSQSHSDAMFGFIGKLLIFVFVVLPILVYLADRLGL